jgi:hypothetical protein
MFKRYLQSEKLPIPETKDKYVITLNGEVFRTDGSRVNEFRDPANNRVVNIWWYGRTQNIGVAFLVAMTFKPLFIPVEQWGLLRVWFFDGNPDNVHASNLMWKYPVALECSTRPGFYYIPCYSRYAINHQSEIIEWRTGEQRPTYLQDGYQACYLTPDVGKPKLASRHRVVMFALSDYPINVDDLQINHKNGIPGSDDVSNLEWTTARENIIHAIETGLIRSACPIYVKFEDESEVFHPSLLKFCKAVKIPLRQIPKIKEELRLNNVSEFDGFTIRPFGEYLERQVFINGPIAIKNVFTGEINVFDYRRDAAAFLNIEEKNINRRLKLDGQPVFTDGTQIKFANDPTPWREIDFVKENLHAPLIKEVLVRDVRTGLVEKFANCVEAGKAEGLGKDVIDQRINAGHQLVWHNYKQYRYNTDLTPWREPENYEDEALNNKHENDVLVRNAITGEIHEFHSQRECAKFLNISETTMFQWITEPGQRIRPGYWQLKLKKDPTPWRIPADPVADFESSKATKVIQRRNAATGEIVEYQSAKDCADRNNVLTTTLNWRLKHGGTKIYSDGFQYKYKADPTPESWLQ